MLTGNVENIKSTNNKDLVLLLLPSLYVLKVLYSIDAWSKEVCSWCWFFFPYSFGLWNRFCKTYLQLALSIFELLILWFVIFWLVKLISTKGRSLRRNKYFHRSGFIQTFLAKKLFWWWCRVRIFTDYII